MKLGLARFQSLFHIHAEKLETGIQARADAIYKQERDLMEGHACWSDLLLDKNISRRLAADISYAFHGLPAADCDLSLLFEKTSIQMKACHRADPDFFEDFMKYCKAVDLAKALCMYGKHTKYKTAPGYKTEHKTWYKRCIEKKMTLPPDDEMGKAWLYDHFPYEFSISLWH